MPCRELSILGDARLREFPCNVVVGVAGSGSPCVRVIGNGGACPIAGARPCQVSALVAVGKLPVDTGNLTIIAGRASVQCFVVVV